MMELHDFRLLTVVLLAISVLNEGLCCMNPWRSNANPSTPRLEFHPQPLEKSSSILHFTYGHEGTWITYADNVNKLLEVYLHSGENTRVCRFGATRARNTVCKFDVDHIQNECSKENHYGYRHGSPCVFLSLTQEAEWTPEYYNDVENLPPEMPASLQAYIQNLQSSSKHQLDVVWVFCEGASIADTENVGNFEYSPIQGFPGYYFPYASGQEDYESPLVAIRFENPRGGITMDVICKAWAKNIKHTPGKCEEGCVTFSLLLD